MSHFIPTVHLPLLFFSSLLSLLPYPLPPSPLPPSPPSSQLSCGSHANRQANISQEPLDHHGNLPNSNPSIQYVGSLAYHLQSIVHETRYQYQFNWTVQYAGIKPDWSNRSDQSYDISPFIFFPRFNATQKWQIIFLPASVWCRCGCGCGCSSLSPLPLLPERASLLHPTRGQRSTEAGAPPTHPQVDNSLFSSSGSECNWQHEHQDKPLFPLFSGGLGGNLGNRLSSQLCGRLDSGIGSGVAKSTKSTHPSLLSSPLTKSTSKTQSLVTPAAFSGRSLSSSRNLLSSKAGQSLISSSTEETDSNMGGQKQLVTTSIAVQPVTKRTEGAPVYNFVSNESKITQGSKISAPRTGS